MRQARACALIIAKSPESCTPGRTARLCAVLQAMFPPGAFAASMLGPGDSSLLLPGEGSRLGRSVLKRIQEFAAGRLCARRALAELGIVDFALQSAQDRQPVWPTSIVGSISHTGGLCVAVVALKSQLKAVGIDCEVVGEVTPDIWPSICTDSEMGWVASLPRSDQPAAVALIFSAKEAFYKCQYPSTGEWMDFHDLKIDAAGVWGAARGSVVFRATRPLAIFNNTTQEIRGQFLFKNAWVIVGVAIAQS